MVIETKDFEKRHGKPNGQERLWEFCVMRENKRLYDCVPLCSYEKAVKSILRTAKKYDADLIKLLP